MLDRIVKSTPLIGGSLVFCGVLKLIFYYSYFNIEIINYLEFQEIITSFFYDINIIMVFSVVMLFITYTSINTVSNKTNYSIKDTAHRMLINMYSHRFKYFLFFFVMFLIIGILLFFKKILFNYFIIYILTASFMQMLTFLTLKKTKEGDIDIPDFYNNIIIGSSLSFSIFLFAQKDIQETLSNKIESKIETTKGTIVCNKKTGNIYIGKTSKYEFIKLKNTNSIIVLPNKEILKYEFK